MPAGNYVLTTEIRVNNRSTRTRCEIYSKLTIKTPKRLYLRRSGVFIVNFEDIPHLVLVFLLLTLNRYIPAGNNIDIIANVKVPVNSRMDTYFFASLIILYMI